MHSRGRVGHLLVGVAIEGDVLPSSGFALEAGGLRVGEVTSVAHSPHAGRSHWVSCAVVSTSLGPRSASMVVAARVSRSDRCSGETAAMRGWLIVFAKAPQPGKVKTRLDSPALARQAAELYRCLLLDALDESSAGGARLGMRSRDRRRPSRRRRGDRLARAGGVSRDRARPLAGWALG